jgi:hypothetical protein
VRDPGRRELQLAALVRHRRRSCRTGGSGTGSSPRTETSRSIVPRRKCAPSPPMQGRAIGLSGTCRAASAKEKSHAIAHEPGSGDCPAPEEPLAITIPPLATQEARLFAASRRTERPDQADERTGHKAWENCRSDRDRATTRCRGVHLPLSGGWLIAAGLRSSFPAAGCRDRRHPRPANCPGPAVPPDAPGSGTGMVPPTL